ncbi:MAG: hypothetical protein IT512_05925 [Rhodocyclaceae bacterium]|nr:hypothetical protein [Rhodocyclaceae bacterium]
MSTDASILASIDTEFGNLLRPEHFTNHAHCCECAEHDELLRSRDRDTLRVEDVCNPGWDPLCFCSPEGLAYFFPSLARFALAEAESRSGWYGDQLLFHLYSGFEENRFFRYCAPSQRQAVAALLAHLIEARAEVIEAYGATDEFLRCHDLWK